MTESYGFVWFLYLSAATGAFVAWWFVTLYMKNESLRIYARMVPAALLFAPASNGGENYAPAFIVALGELVSHGLMAAMAGIIPILVSLAAGVFILTLYTFWRRN